MKLAAKGEAMKDWRNVPTVVCLAKQKLKCNGALDIAFESWSRAKAWGRTLEDTPDTVILTVFSDGTDLAAFEFEKFSEGEVKRAVTWLRQIARTFNRAADKLEKL